jgi:integrase
MLRGLVKFSENRGYIDGTNPMRGIENPAPYKPKRPNAAKDEQIVAFFKAFAKSEVSPTTKNLAELEIYTGCRSSEARKARWAQVNLSKREWVIPIDDDKMSRGFKIHLSDRVLEIFKEAKAFAPGSDLVFPAPMSTKEEKIVGFGVVGQAIKRFANQTDDENFLKMTSHDLRKTLKTMMSRIGIQPHVSELCLNHTEKNILRRIYDGYDYWPEMVSAWDRAGAHLDALRSGGALVIPITSKHAA